MTPFNEKLKKIRLKEILILIILLYLLQYTLNTLNITIGAKYLYLIIVLYILYKLKNEIFTIKKDIRDLFKLNILKNIIILVILNIFLSYGMLYLSDEILNIAPSIKLLFNSFLSGSLIATIFLSPISEELIFRGVFINRLKLIVPPIFSILISSLLFASLHTYGSIFSAFIFGLSMSILYIQTDNIFVPIFAHFLNNLIAETIVYFDTANVLFTNIHVIQIMSVLAIISFIILLIIMILGLRKIKNNS
ncbi:MAG: CPBP family intramembrane metalloprotease [Methanobrevibacter thaueri]|nr:CPBP family intramembrane metalloprotease [Methanobrevibacter thaueri]